MLGRKLFFLALGMWSIDEALCVIKEDVSLGAEAEVCHQGGFSRVSMERPFKEQPKVGRPQLVALGV